MLNETHEAIQGRRQSWSLIKKIGEGDAGEVYLVESLLDKQPAIVKRPRKGAFFSDTLRQASQIKREGSILYGLPKPAFSNKMLGLKVPSLLDQNKTEAEVGERTFIIIEKANGFNLKQLSQIIRFGPGSIEPDSSGRETAHLIEQWSQFTEFPAPLLVRILLGVLTLLETIHNCEIRSEQGVQRGVIWNDVKPEHLYWDPLKVGLTAIDWGNSQFLESEGVTKDRQYSSNDDFRQFNQEMGSFISEANPNLYARLEWPGDATGISVYEGTIRPLKERLTALNETHSQELQALRRQEAALYDVTRPDLEQIAEYETLQRQFAEHGEMPDQRGANSFMIKAAYQMAAENQLAGFNKICQIASQLPGTTAEKWILLDGIAEVASQVENRKTRAAFSNALADGLAGDWPAALWELFSHLGDGLRPDWWEKISEEIRKVCLGLDEETIAPYTMFARLYFTLRAEVTRIGEQRLRGLPSPGGAAGPPSDGFNWQASEELISTFNEEIIKKWKETDPYPPNSGIGYTEVDSLTLQVEEILPGTRKTIDNSMAQLRAQVSLVLEAWEKKDFELARRGLRSILIWDPDRARLYTAGKAISEAPKWLARLRKGASKDEPFYDFLTSVELAGRTLRNRVGPAKWLDETLEVLKRLRKGTRSVDLLIEYPETMHELPWLSEYQSREIISLPHTRTLTIERDPGQPPPATITTGVVEGRFGLQQEMTLGEALDTWLPEARGSSARVFAGTMLDPAKQLQALAIKIMRPDQVDYARPLFIEEIQVLTLLRDVAGVTPLIECGFIKLAEGQTLPTDESHAPANQISGQVIHYGVEQAQNLIASMDRQLAAGWLPYLALVKREAEHNLLHYCDTSHTHGWFLSLRDSLILAMQICDILQFAHDRNIAYRDHKILHYYWDPTTHGVAMIDWNIAKRQPQGLTEVEKQFDLVQFGARGLHHIFTGRPAQGSLPLGPNRPEDIEKASTHYPVSWTYDDERLPEQLRTILETALNQGYTQVREIRQDLLGIYQQLPSADKK